MPPQLTIDDDAQPLSRRLGNANFQQQGQLDWVSLSRTSINFSLGILARLSAASVDPYTVTVGHFIGSNFDLSRNGRRNIEEALKSLHCFKGIGDTIWFGFGIQHVVRAISATEQGATLVALCATLSECFEEEIAAEILMNIAKRTADLKIVPSIGEWLSMVRCCAGTFSTTSFPLRAETLMRMQTNNIKDLIYARSGNVVIGDPAEIAEALLAVGKISQGSWKSVSIIGPRESGWIAAVAEWLFGLTVTITDEDGNLKYSSSPPGQSANLHVFYETEVKGDRYSSALRVTDRTFALRSAVSLITLPLKPWKRTAVAHICGRVNWQECLSAAFGVHFKKLVKMENTVGDILGNAARIFEAIAKAEEGIPAEILESNQLYSEHAFGVDFLQNALHWLPELDGAAPSMHRAYEQALNSDTWSRYEARFQLLASTCGCRLCSRGLSEDSQCLLLLMETIIVLCRLLSIVEVADSLYPSLRGLHMLRSTQTGCNYMTGAKGSPGSVFRILHLNGKYAMEAVLALFSGRLIMEEDKKIPNCSAISLGGLCVYMDSLREPLDHRQSLGRLHVLPGQIECNERLFSYVEDWPDSSEVGLNPSKKSWAKMQDRACMSSVKVSVRETVHSLFVRYDILNEQNRPTNMSFRPCSLVHAASSCRGRVFCPDSHRKEGAGVRETVPTELESLLLETDIEVHMLKAPLLGRCAALMHSNPLETLFLRDGECLVCCIKTALRQNATQIIIISKEATEQ